MKTRRGVDWSGFPNGETNDHRVLRFNRPFFLMLQDAHTGSTVACATIDAASARLSPVSPNPLSQSSPRSVIAVGVSGVMAETEADKYSSITYASAYSNASAEATIRHGQQGHRLDVDPFYGIACAYPVNPYWYLGQEPQRDIAGWKAMTLGEIVLDESVVRECFGDLETRRPEGISRHELSRFYSQFVETFPEASARLKRRALAYLQRFVVEQSLESPPVLEDLPQDFRGRRPIGIWTPEGQQRQDIVSRYQDSGCHGGGGVRKEPRSAHGGGGVVVGPGMVFRSDSSCGSSADNSLLPRREPTDSRGWRDVEEGQAGQSFMREGETQLPDPTCSYTGPHSRLQKRLRPAGAKPVIGLEVTSHVPRSVAQADDLVDCNFIRQGEAGYLNPTVCPEDRLVAIDGWDIEMAPLKTLVLHVKRAPYNRPETLR